MDYSSKISFSNITQFKVCLKVYFVVCCLCMACSLCMHKEPQSFLIYLTNKAGLAVVVKKKCTPLQNELIILLILSKQSCKISGGNSGIFSCCNIHHRKQTYCNVSLMLCSPSLMGGWHHMSHMSLLQGIIHLPKQCSSCPFAQSKMARCLTNTRCSKSITPVPAKLYWLPFHYRINFRI